MDLTRLTLVGALVACSGCSEREISFEHLQTADRVQVATATNRPVATITDTAKVQAVLEFLDAHRSGWSERLGGSLPRLILRFFDGDHFLGSIGVGPDYLADQPERSLASTAVRPSEITSIMASLGVSLEPGGE